MQKKRARSGLLLDRTIGLKSLCRPFSGNAWAVDLAWVPLTVWGGRRWVSRAPKLQSCSPKQRLSWRHGCLDQADLDLHSTGSVSKFFPRSRFFALMRIGSSLDLEAGKTRQEAVKKPEQDDHGISCKVWGLTYSEELVASSVTGSSSNHCLLQNRRTSTTAPVRVNSCFTAMNLPGKIHAKIFGMDYPVVPLYPTCVTVTPCILYLTVFEISAT